jgi:hypothetical protein
MRLLRDGLLTGRRVALGGGVSGIVRDALLDLGAELELLPRADELVSPQDEQTGEWARACAPLQALVYDSRAGFGTGGPEGLEAALEQAWVAVREVATGALIPAQAPGKLVLLGPSADAGPLAEAARAGLENLTRTLSVEWARYELTAVMIAPGPSATEDDLATVVCFVVSEAGGYISGCRLELGAIV